LKPRIEKLDEMTVVGMVIKTTMKNNKIPLLWDEFSKQMDKISNSLYKEAALGLCFPVDKEEFTDEDEFQYMACVPVTSRGKVPKGMIVRKIPACTYAVFTHMGALDTLHDTYEKIFSEGMKGLKMAKADEIEWYGEKFKYGKPESELYIYVPIKS
jgi:AraC family transcriptional regulator